MPRAVPDAAVHQFCERAGGIAGEEGAQHQPGQGDASQGSTLHTPVRHSFVCRDPPARHTTKPGHTHCSAGCGRGGKGEHGGGEEAQAGTSKARVVVPLSTQQQRHEDMSIPGKRLACAPVNQDCARAITQRQGSRPVHPRQGASRDRQHRACMHLAVGLSQDPLSPLTSAQILTRQTPLHRALSQGATKVT